MTDDFVVGLRCALCVIESAGCRLAFLCPFCCGRSFSFHSEIGALPSHLCSLLSNPICRQKALVALHLPALAVTVCLG